MNKQQPFGTWDSPISAEMVTTAGVRLGGVAYSGGAAFWSEARPNDAGRGVIVKCLPGEPPIDLFASPFNVRTRVHEYGGGSWWVDTDYLYFVHWDDQRLYRVQHSKTKSGNAQQTPVPEPLTPTPLVPQSLRYADGCVSADSSWIVCVRERHESVGESVEESVEESGDNAPAVVHNELVVMPNGALKQDDDKPVRVIASGADFYSTPRLSPNGKQLSWIQWAHPQMPWDGTELMIAEVQSDMTLSNPRVVSGGIQTSVMGALWTQAGELVFASDQSGWWNLYRYTPAAPDLQQITDFNDREVGTPAWVFGTQRFVELLDGATSLGLAMIVTKAAKDAIHILRPSGNIDIVASDCVAISSMAANETGGVVLHAQSANRAASISSIDCRLVSQSTSQNENQASIAIDLKPSENLGIDNAWLSAPEAITFKVKDRDAHAFFYPPSGLELCGKPDELPPLIVMGHGGPTSHATAALKLSIQFWTSRGIAVVDVNYGGSSGFGRDYRRLLNGQWGVVDVEDCVGAVEYLSQNGRVDPARMVIRGGSAGGLTVLRALQTSKHFAGGTSLYGVTDLEMLAGDTHKFESRYLDGLLGGPYPEFKSVYVERSPIHHADQLNCPILVLQGDEDKVVPPNQSAAIVEAAAKKGLPHAYVLFAGEQHGFRQTENIIRALKLELWFYGCVLAFTPANNIEAPEEAVGFS